MKTVAVDKSAGGGDTLPLHPPGTSRPHSSAKTPFILGIGKRRNVHGGRKGKRGER